MATHELAYPTGGRAARATRALAASTLTALALLAGPAASAQDGGGVQRYVQTAAGGAELRTSPDPKGLPVRSLRGGVLLAVHGDHDGWLMAEPPNGLEVWVYGEYLMPTGSPGWLEVTGNGVNMRPQPHSQRTSFPLAQRLHRGDRVRLVARQDPSLPAEEDWFRVITPPGIWAYVSPSSTQPVAAGVDARAAWDAAVREAASAPGALASAPAPERPAATPGTQSRLEAAQQLFDQESVKPSPDWPRVRRAFADVVEHDSQSSAAAVARRKLDEIDLRISLAQMQAQLAEEKRAREAELAQIRTELEKTAMLEKDPLWGRFDARGWLEREKLYGDRAPRYILVWAGERKAEIVCESGRYDLDIFAGFELGLLGRQLQRPREAAAPQMSIRTRTPEPRPELPILDIRRLEVISARAMGR